MKRFYDFLEIPSVNLNFNQIDQTIKEDEEVYEYTGLLKIRPRLEMKQPDARQVLGNDVYDWIMQNFKGYNDYFGYR
jgi:hypothetical protein